MFQNSIKSKQSQLVATLGPQTAAAFGGGAAGANIGLIKGLPDSQKFVARQAFADSLSNMWILYAVFAAAGLATSFLIGENTLDKKHEETRTGLDVEKQMRVEREAERAERRKKRQSKGNLPIDAEAQGDGARVLGAAEAKETKA